MIKKFIFLFFLFAVLSMPAQQIEWLTMNKALELQEKEPKKIMVFFYAEWCKNCHKMNDKTFVNKDVAEFINKHYYAVNFNGEGTEKVLYKDFEYTNPNYNPEKKGRNYQHFFADALKVTAYPTLMFFDENAETISPVVGYQSVEDIEVFLKLVASDDYKTVLTKKQWKDYKRKFKSRFRDNQI